MPSVILFFFVSYSFFLLCSQFILFAIFFTALNLINCGFYHLYFFLSRKINETKNIWLLITFLLHSKITYIHITVGFI